ncbi:MAG: sulfurtransferase [Nitrospinota bacterium]
MKRACLYLLAGLLAIAGWTGGASAAPYARPELLVSTQQLAGLLQDPEVKILDARGAEEYKAGHIPGAISLPVAATVQNERWVPAVLAPMDKLVALLGGKGIKPTDTLVVYDEAVGIFAARLFWTFDVLGHPKVRLLDGGMSKWAKEGRPISQEVPSPAAAQYTPKPDWTKFADAAYVLVNLNNPRVVLVDCRSPREFSGEVASQQVKRAGRIPGAKHVDSDDHLVESGGMKVFKNADELAQAYAKAGASKDKEIITYCRTGVRGSLGYLGLRLLGYPTVRLYDASMIEWGNRPELPVEKTGKK